MTRAYPEPSEAATIRKRRVTRPVLELLEGRQLLASLSADAFEQAYNLTRYNVGVQQSVYYKVGANSYSADGAGQTIAIIEQGQSGQYDQALLANLAKFDTAENLPSPPANGVVQQTIGGASVDNYYVDQETDLDVQWAHAIAPAADILVVNALASATNNPSTTAYPTQTAFAEAAYAAAEESVNSAPVTSVSMSYGFSAANGYPEPMTAAATALDAYFTTPATTPAHAPVAFFASSGDTEPFVNNQNTVQWPATSPNVVAVGGTTLGTTKKLSQNGDFQQLR